MKTTKSIIVVLFVLLTAQFAAYYCPSAGRWLSRDPMGEPGFENLRAARVVPMPGQIISPSSLPPSRWINRDSIAAKNDPNRYAFVRNEPMSKTDALGLIGPVDPLPPGQMLITLLITGVLPGVARIHIRLLYR